MRKYFIDNLRFICVLLLFPYHVCMIYNALGENFYIRGPEVELLSTFILITSPWFMPLLFVIAGISSAYALKKRTAKQFIKERFFKLFLPLAVGILTYIPIQTYFAERYHNDYSGGFFHQYVLFFTKPTDLTGYTGGFTPAHLWFILYLFAISLLALPIMMKYIKSARKVDGAKLTLPKIIPMFLFSLILTPVFDMSGKSIGQFFALFLLGFFILSNDQVLNLLEKNRSLLFCFGIVFTVVSLVIYNKDLDHGILFDIFYYLLKWIGILAILGMGKHFLNFNTKFTTYLSKASFPIYFFHQTWIVAAAFYVFKISSSVPVQVLLILSFSVLVTFLNYEIFRRMKVTRFLFGMKK